METDPTVGRLLARYFIHLQVQKIWASELQGRERQAAFEKARGIIRQEEDWE